MTHTHTDTHTDTQTRPLTCIVDMQLIHDPLVPTSHDDYLVVEGYSPVAVPRSGGGAVALLQGHVPPLHIGYAFLGVAVHPLL